MESKTETTFNAWAIVVPMSHAQRMRQQLQSLTFWDCEHRLQKVDHGHLAIPILVSCVHLVKEIYPQYETIRTLLPLSKKERAKKTSPSQLLRSRILAILQHDNLSICLLDEIPKKWERHGDLVILQAGCFSSPHWEMFGPGLWQLVADSLSCQRVARSSAVSQDGFRSSQVEMLLGSSGWVTSVDNNVKYSFDVTKCMFSSGNITEKLRVAKFDCRDKIVVDMYAGIGYFTLPYLIHGGATYLHACEWNPAAVEALRYNLVENGVETRCTIHEGDNRKLQLTSVADVVNLGLIPSSEAGWPVAVQVLSLHGGVMHIHGNVSVPKGSHGDIRCIQNRKYAQKHINHDQDSTNQNLQTEYKNSTNQNLQTSQDITNQNLQMHSDQIYKDSTDQTFQTDEDTIFQNLHSNKSTTDQNLQIHETSTHDYLTQSESSIIKLYKNHNEHLQPHENLIKPLYSDNHVTESLTEDTSISQSDVMSPTRAHHDSGYFQENDFECFQEIDKSQSSKRDLVMNSCQVWSTYVKKRILNLLQEKKGGSWIVQVTHIEIVKPYAPHIWHVVLDLDCRPTILEKI